MEEDTGRTNHHNRQTELPPNGNGTHAPTRGTSTDAASEGLTIAGTVLPTVVTHLTFGTPDPPAIPYRARGGARAANNITSKNKTGLHLSESKEAPREAKTPRL